MSLSEIYVLKMLNKHRKLTIEGMITVQLVSSLTRLDFTSKESMLLFVCSEAVDSKLVKLETSRTVILPQRGEVSGTSFTIFKLFCSRSCRFEPLRNSRCKAPLLPLLLSTYKSLSPSILRYVDFDKK